MDLVCRARREGLGVCVEAHSALEDKVKDKTKRSSRGQIKNPLALARL